MNHRKSVFMSHLARIVLLAAFLVNAFLAPTYAQILSDDALIRQYHGKIHLSYRRISEMNAEITGGSCLSLFPGLTASANQFLKIVKDYGGELIMNQSFGVIEIDLASPTLRYLMVNTLEPSMAESVLSADEVMGIGRLCHVFFHGDAVAKTAIETIRGFNQRVLSDPAHANPDDAALAIRSLGYRDIYLTARTAKNVASIIDQVCWTVQSQTAGSFNGTAQARQLLARFLRDTPAGINNYISDRLARSLLPYKR